MSNRIFAPAFAAALAVGLAGGALCAWLGTPLPWLLGALFGCAGFNLAGAGLRAPTPARNTGQWVIGMALGLYFTPEVMGRLVELAPYIAAGVVYALLLGLGFTWSLMRFAAADPPTAFFSGAVGGASEMAVHGERNGGSVALLAAAHSLRVMMVVSILPFAYQLLQVHGGDSYVPSVTVVDYPALGLLGLACAAGGLFARRIGSPNAWVLGPLFVAGGLSLAGQAGTALPAWLVNLGQVLIGVSLGTRFAPGFFARAPRFLGVMAVSTLIAIVLSASFGWLLARLSGMSPATLILATSPGGIAEMSLTAKVLQLGVPVVAIFHVVRYIALVLAIGTLYRWMARWLGWAAAPSPENEPGTGRIRESK